MRAHLADTALPHLSAVYVEHEARPDFASEILLSAVRSERHERKRAHGHDDPGDLSAEAGQVAELLCGRRLILSRIELEF